MQRKVLLFSFFYPHSILHNASSHLIFLGRSILIFVDEIFYYAFYRNCLSFMFQYVLYLLSLQQFFYNSIVLKYIIFPVKIKILIFIKGHKQHLLRNHVYFIDLDCNFFSNFEPQTTRDSFHYQFISVHNIIIYRQRSL